MSRHKAVVGIIGGSSASGETLRIAYEVGMYVARNDAALVCGGLGGVMEASARGAAEHDGTVIGILPSSCKADANPYVSIVIPSGLGVARNALVVATADVLIAFPGSYGTLSEIGLALNTGKTVVYLPGAWDLRRAGNVDAERFKEAFDAFHAVGLAIGDGG